MENQYTKAVVDCATNTIINVPMTEEEIASYEQTQAEFLQLEAERQAKADALNALKESAKAKLIAGEPLTDEEAAAIVI